MSLPFPQGLEVIFASDALEASFLSLLMECDWDKQGECFIVAWDIWPPVVASTEKSENHTHVHFYLGDEQSELLTDRQWNE